MLSGTLYQARDVINHCGMKEAIRGEDNDVQTAVYNYISANLLYDLILKTFHFNSRMLIIFLAEFIF